MGKQLKNMKFKVQHQLSTVPEVYRRQMGKYKHIPLLFILHNIAFLTGPLILNGSQYANFFGPAGHKAGPRVLKCPIRKSHIRYLNAAAHPSKINKISARSKNLDKKKRRVVS